MTRFVYQTLALAFVIPLFIVLLITMASIFDAFAATAVRYERFLPISTLTLFAATFAACMIFQRNQGFGVFWVVDVLDKDSNLVFFFHCTPVTV